MSLDDTVRRPTGLPTPPGVQAVDRLNNARARFWDALADAVPKVTEELLNVLREDR